MADTARAQGCGSEVLAASWWVLVCPAGQSCSSETSGALATEAVVVVTLDDEVDAWLWLPGTDESHLG